MKTKRKKTLKRIIFIIAILDMFVSAYIIKTLLNEKQTIPKCNNCNVIIASLDTLSASHLPCYGYYRNTAPNLCDFGKKNIFFENAFANAHWTLPSDISMFTGLYPSKTTLTKYYDTLPKGIMLLPTYLKEIGYDTYFFAPRDDAGFPIKNVYDQLGISIYNDRDTSWSNSLALFKSNVKAGKKTFMYLHTYDVHEPFLLNGAKQIYEPLNSKFPTSLEQFNGTLEINPELAQMVYKDAKTLGVNANYTWFKNKEISQPYVDKILAAGPDFTKLYPILKEMRSKWLLYDTYRVYDNYKRLIDYNNQNDIDTLRALYDQTISIADQHKVTQLVNLINDPAIKDNTILIIYSEHGEEFMEHGHLFHETLYNPNIKIPLIMHIPGEQNKDIKKPVSLADITPTLTELLGLSPINKYQARSLVNDISGIDKKNYLEVTDGYDLQSKVLIYWPWKLLMSKLQNGTYLPYELYNLATDPGETKNVLLENYKIKDKILKLSK